MFVRGISELVVAVAVSQEFEWGAVDTAPFRGSFCNPASPADLWRCFDSGPLAVHRRSRRRFRTGVKEVILYCIW